MTQPKFKRLMAAIVAGSGGGGATQTYRSARMIGANAAPVNDFSKSIIYTNLLNQSRGFTPIADPFSFTASVTLNGKGYPADGQSFAVVAMTNLVAENFGVYTVEFTGQCSSVAGLLGCVTGTPSYDSGTGKTSFLLTAANGVATGVALSVTSPTGIDNFKLMALGYATNTTKVYRDEVLAHFSNFTNLRFMDWLLTNNSTVVDWAGSNHSSVLPAGYRSSLKSCFDFAAACGGTDLQVNIPHQASDAFITSFVAQCVALLPAGRKLDIEYSNETWNFLFNQWAEVIIAACNVANIRHARAGDVVSINRVSNVVTVTLNSAHGKNTGDSVYVGTTGLTDSGVVPITVTGANTFTYAQTGADVNGTIKNDFTTFVCLNPTHELCVTSTGPYSGYTGTSALKAARRYEQTRMRVIYNAIVAAGGDTSRIKVVKGVLFGYVFDEKDAISFAVGKYGDLNHCDNLDHAPYLQPSTPATFTDATSVFTQLETVRAAQKISMTKQINFWGTLGMRHMRSYEGGPHTDSKPNTTANAAIAAAHADDRMRVLIMNLVTDFRDRGGETFNYYMGGAIDTFGGTQNNTFHCCLAPIETAPLQPKYQALQQIALSDPTPQSLDAVTWGSIQLSTVWDTSMIAAGNGNVILSNVWAVPDLGLWVTPPDVGTYTLQADFHGHLSAAMTVQVFVNDVAQGAAVALPSGNYATDITNPTITITKSVALNKGKNWVAFRMQAAPRATQVYGRTLRLGP